MQYTKVSHLEGSATNICQTQFAHVLLTQSHPNFLMEKSKSVRSALKWSLTRWSFAFIIRKSIKASIEMTKAAQTQHKGLDLPGQ